MKLNKLLYFSYGLYYAKVGKELFKNDFVAEQYGPVIKEVYKKFCHLKSSPIEIGELDFGDETFTDDEEEVLTDVLAKYDLTASQLSKLTHISDTPWSKTEQGKIISKALIHEYFEKNYSKTSNLPEELPICGRIDENGDTILPADDDTKEDNWCEN
jgi:uncharacterized phage-associated protein